MQPSDYQNICPLRDPEEGSKAPPIGGLGKFLLLVMTGAEMNIRRRKITSLAATFFRSEMEKTTSSYSMKK